MKCLTLYRPIDYAIIHGKDVENRSWPPPKSVFGTRIALHAGKVYDYDLATFVRRTLELETTIPQTQPGVFASALVAGWVRKAERGREAMATSPEFLPLLESPWFFGPYGWALTELHVLSKRVLCNGAQGLWTLPHDVYDKVYAQDWHPPDGRL